MVSLLAAPVRACAVASLNRPMGQLTILRRVCSRPITSLRLSTDHLLARSFSTDQKIMAPTKRPAAEGDRSISPPPLKRKAQTAISSSSYDPSTTQRGHALTVLTTFRERRRKLFHPCIPETERTNNLGREKPTCRLPSYPSRSQVRPGTGTGE